MATGTSRPTLRDVARAAGVSIGTASNAFNHPERLAPARRDRVLEHARALGYAGPDPAGRRLRTGRAGALGLVFTDRLTLAFEDPAATCFLGGVAGAIEPAGLGLLVVPVGTDREAAAEIARQAAVDGFIVYSVPTGDPRLRVALERGLPTVTVDQPRDTPTPFVGIDDRAAARTAARHLRDLGHERIGVLAFASSPADAPELRFELTAERLKGYRQGLGPAWDPGLVRVCLPSSAAEAGRVATDLLGADDRPTAILAMSDELAVGAMGAAREGAIDVPTDLSIVGFDDSSTARLAVPALTSVFQPLGRKGEEAAQLLIPSLQGDGRKPRRRRVILPTELIIRGSTAPPRR
jgi:DNA-binding LacI/PurR family transcriptional regulator